MIVSVFQCCYDITVNHYIYTWVVTKQTTIKVDDVTEQLTLRTIQKAKPPNNLT